jgi:hypothetical protein
MTGARFTERDFQRAVIDYARRLGWRVAHFRTSPTQSGGWATAVQADGAGFPDLVLVRRERLLFVELKGKAGRVSPAQAEWLAALERVDDDAAGVGVYVWKPADWPVIELVLA